MWQGSILFTEAQAPLPHAVFAEIVARYDGDWHVHFVDCWALMQVLVWAQLTGRESLRDIEEGVAAHAEDLLPDGIVSGKRSTIARALKERPWQIAAEFTALLQEAWAGDSTHPVPQRLYSIDATVIELCKTTFPWAVFKQGKGGLKLHMLWDHQHDQPCLLNVTAANQREFSTARALRLPSGAILCCDRGYVDFAWFEHLRQRGITLITRARANWIFQIVERRPCRDQPHITSDWVVRLCGPRSCHKYPGLLRRIRYLDPHTGKVWLIMTTNLELPAATLVALYRKRWEIEEFFKWIKQNLKIRAFYGTSYNAVMWQVHAALCLYLLLQHLKRKHHLTASLFQIQRRLKEQLYCRLPLARLFAVPSHTAKPPPSKNNN